MSRTCYAWALLAASTIAILTTIGIVLSMLFQTINLLPIGVAFDFFFGTVWDPRFAAAGSGGSQGQFGLIPLLAGTLYIALVAMLVAVPVGLMSPPSTWRNMPRRSVRSVVKPLLELLAGIPTIVYGIFALVTARAIPARSQCSTFRRLRLSSRRRASSPPASSWASC